MLKFLLFFFKEVWNQTLCRKKAMLLVLGTNISREIVSIPSDIFVTYFIVMMPE